MNNLKFIFPLAIYEYTGKIEETFLVNKEIKDNLGKILDNDVFSNPPGWNDGVVTNIKHRFDTITDYDLKNLKSYIESHVDQYIKSIDSNHPVPIFLIHSWINFTDKNQGQDWHQHDDAVISGVYYYDTSGDDGDLIFKTPNPFINNEAFPTGSIIEKYHRIKPCKGKLVLFPGWLEHKVERNQTSHTRISISFNFLRDNFFKNRRED